MIDHLIENKIKLEDDNDILALVRYFREASDRDIIISMRRLTTDPDQEFQRHYWNLFETDSRFVLFGMFIMDLANMAKVELERVIENCDGTWVGALDRKSVV